MEFSELIHARRSVRGFAAPAPHAALMDILSKAQQAPSWKNVQEARCYAVEGGEALDAVRQALPEFNRRSSENAALLVTTCVRGLAAFTKGEPDNELGDAWGVYDLGLRDAYLVLAAADAGFDTLIMGIRDADAIRAALSIPENETILAVIAVGTRAKEPTVRPRKPLDEVASFRGE